MRNSRASGAKRHLHQTLRKVFSFFPRAFRFAVYRSFVDCDPKPDKRLVLKIAETKEELEACFRLLHDAYVGSGFMKPDPSGMRATIYHALPTTTTLCAKFDGEVVGTLSLIRESVFGFPLQSIFDLHDVREKKGRVAEVSALAVHPKFRKTGGTILFPLMKFMYEYCTTYFDTRHLVIAVNPNRIEMYESLLFFERLTENSVDNYDFANGAPAVGASLDLHVAPEIFKRVYGKKPRRKNLYLYFLRTRLRNIVMPGRRYFTTNDPVMTPDLLDYFFNERTHTFQDLDDREKGLLHSIYNLPEYQRVLPPVFSESTFRVRQRKHQRYSLKCPGSFSVTTDGKTAVYALSVVEFSDDGFLANSKTPLPGNVWGAASVRLGSEEKSVVKAMVVRGNHKGSYGFYGFKLAESDLAWRKLVGVLKSGTTHEDLDNATRFLQD
ncbi:MAG: GNAT family N-acetyltransferase [Rhodoferax sp.]|uniref:GNAT family N-acetyltransferase n=1 Tax=Rhodoferax sp. TaxID=50421 RepID=UPI00271D59C9|nr:GNAT family N-acetyltransferase [Rhodoferax sp.]MDO8450912.1 GNAT family N-acetyltransferase [Rhodoferax sp.]